MEIIELEQEKEPFEIEEESTLSFCQVFRYIAGLGILMAFSFTFSFEVVLAVFMLTYLSDSNEETAAATLVSVLMNTVCTLGMSSLFAVSIYLSAKLREWKALTDHPENEMDENSVEEKKMLSASTLTNSLLISLCVAPPSFLTLFFSKDILILSFIKIPSPWPIQRLF